MTLVSIGIVTWNAGAVIERCLDSIQRQNHRSFQLLVVDNASTDDTTALLERRTARDERVLLERNTGFAAAHNRALALSTGEYYLALNPDVFLDPDFLMRLLEVLQHDPGAGSASGKLLRADEPSRIDSAGICMLPSQRHLDRGSDTLDVGQFDTPVYVFGASGAAALYRRAMLEDLRVCGEIFDEDFFAYREDADLAWRAQLLGWRCRYVPAARAYHVRHVTPERRRRLSPKINRYSVRNRFLLRIKNQTPSNAWRCLLPMLWRDLQVIGYVLLREHRSLPALVDVARLLPRVLAKRREIMRRRRIPSADVDRWFKEASRPLGAFAMGSPRANPSASPL